MTASDRPAPRREHRTASRTLAFTLAGTAGLLGLVAVSARRSTSSPIDSIGENEPSRPTQDGAIDRWVVGGTVVAALVAGGVLIVRDRTPRRSARPDTPGRRVEAVAAIDESLAALRMEPDCRRAVIAAYARMERWLAVAGMARAPSEGPGEFVERVVNLGGPAPAATTLTELFQEAKFSRHPVDSTMKQRALDALIDLRSALARRP